MKNETFDIMYDKVRNVRIATKLKCCFLIIYMIDVSHIKLSVAITVHFQYGEKEMINSYSAASNKNFIGNVIFNSYLLKYK